MIRLENVTKRYSGGAYAVRDLTLDIPTGETVVFIGPSGCGKTTTLRMVNRLVEPDAGRILLDGEDVTHIDPVALRLRMGYVIQQTGLFPHLDVAANVATVPRLLGWDRERIRKRVDELLDLVGLEPDRYRGRYPHQLSGGQRQRVGFARALGVDPPILLMDEPFGAVDRITRERLQAEFIRIQRTVRKTVVFVTHDIDEAVRVGDRICLLAEQAQVAQYDTPAGILGRPANDFVREFLGRERVLRRMSVLAVQESGLEPPGGTTEGRATIQLGTRLSEAFSAVLSSPDGRVAVLDEAGHHVGEFTAAALQERLRRDDDGSVMREVDAT